MTEEEWWESDRPHEMVLLLLRSNPLRLPPSDRKLRLFICACVRHRWDLLHDERWRAAVKVGELYADGKVTDYDLSCAWVAANHANRPDQHGYNKTTVLAATCAAHSPDIGETLSTWLEYKSMLQADLLRDIFGNPWQPVHYGAGGCLGRRPYDYVTPLVCSLAEAAYNNLKSDKNCSVCQGTGIYFWWDKDEGRTAKAVCNVCDKHTIDNHRLLVLSDALEEAGCDDETILDHLRGPNSHVCGCHVLDLILGKK